MSDPRETSADSTDGHVHAESYCPACNQSFAPTVEKCPQDGTKLVRFAAQRDELIGRVLDGRFEVRSPLGRGGMGTVYRALQVSVDREVAVKVIHPKLAGDRQAAKRFLREARLASRLNQGNIVNVIDFGQTEDGVLYLVMELLRGRTLATELGGHRRLTVRRTATIALQLCDALEAAHAQGIVHRDLKPGNIVILDDPPGRDQLKVLDFGLAKSLVTDTTSRVTNTDAIIGTPLYMCPEQIQGRPSDQRADLYALGCILYELLTGTPPFVDTAVNLILARHLSDPPAPLPAHVPALLRTLVERLLAKDPDARVQTAAEARAVVQAVIEGGGLAAIPEQADTVPSLPMEYAATADVSEPAATTPVPTAGTTGGSMRTPAAVSSIAPHRRSRIPLVIGGLLLTGGATALAIALTRGTGEPGANPPAAGPVDAAMAVTAPVDPPSTPAAPAVDAAVAEARATVDAAAPSPVRDAGRPDRDRHRRADARTISPPPPKVDAAPAVTPPRKVDAEPDVDFVPSPTTP